MSEVELNYAEMPYGQSDPWDPVLEGKIFAASWKSLTGCPNDEPLEDWAAAQNDAYKMEFSKEEEGGKNG